MAWPTGISAGDTYVLSLYDQRFSVPEIVLPDHCTIRLPLDWPKDPHGRYLPLHWVADRLTFGVGCRIDLSPQEPGPEKPPKARSGGGAGIGQVGGAGEWGVPGQAGNSGVNLLLQIQTWTPKGSLWIQTDGQSGADGGDGGDGGPGGPGKCDLFGFGGPDGGNGGRGGDGGSGGAGGDTSRVRIEVRAVPGGITLPKPYCIRPDGPMCPPSRPPEDTNDGIIRVYGMPGCGGRPGRGGIGGAHGPGANCGWLRPDRKPGVDGPNGAGDPHDPRNPCLHGPEGRCSESYFELFGQETPDSTH